MINIPTQPKGELSWWWSSVSENGEKKQIPSDDLLKTFFFPLQVGTFWTDKSVDNVAG